MTTLAADTPARLWPWSGFAAVLAGAGLPIYIYAPKFYADSYGVPLTALGAVLFGLRLLDVVQDPALGWLSERLRTRRTGAVTLAGALLALGMLALFAVAPPIAPLVWFALALILLFSAYSFLTITFYAQGIARAETLPGGHLQLAGWRETGALLGVCLAAMAPSLLQGAVVSPFAVFAFGFAACTALAVWGMSDAWGAAPAPQPTAIRSILSDHGARGLLLLALVNATPLAVSSTLFLFFVESRLQAPGWEGPLLVLFFLAAAATAPGWSMLASRLGAKPVLIGAMGLAIISFIAVPLLGPGDVVWFALICLASGATIGADLVLLPALFARRMSRLGPDGAQGFGLWAFATKFTLAFAAATLLPILDAVGFQSGGNNTAEALTLLTLLYALVPSALKVVALVLLLSMPIEDD